MSTLHRLYVRGSSWFNRSPDQDAALAYAGRRRLIRHPATQVHQAIIRLVIAFGK